MICDAEFSLEIHVLAATQAFQALNFNLQALSTQEALSTHLSHKVAGRR
jgi:hypothetical protein